ncbi:DUF1206 domain-containing protein [Cellulomonas marina]|uniref:DUF1206 domain-containing protein n=1 Tax=Cellulomonas marina TaxID=988821 RepID=A0A1I0ZJX7_9CELL|nr:DUF1206 domain-containing protein [Cellulomonas marina]GIG28556.1 membrane protein [Cellulomonas marina]SFB24708.1 protein of unknown function [Cellulomonas marina]
MATHNTPASARRAATEAGDNPLVEQGARVGYAANGVLHLLIAWLAVQLAWTAGAGSADQTGALRSLAGNPVGTALLWVVVVGFALLAVWQVTELLTRHDTGDRVKAGAKAVVYGVLAWTAVRVLLGTSQDGSQQTSSTTGRLLEAPLGRALVAAVGLAVLGVAVHHVVKGWRRTFLQDLTEHPGRWAVQAGRVGYVAKGVALAVVGFFFLKAAWTGNAAEAQGLDGALRAFLEVPWGRGLLTVVALGLAAYGVYSFARARYARV